jgi:hypothetical protein
MSEGALVLLGGVQVHRHARVVDGDLAQFNESQRGLQMGSRLLLQDLSSALSAQDQRMAWSAAILRHNRLALPQPGKKRINA